MILPFHRLDVDFSERHAAVLDLARQAGASLPSAVVPGAAGGGLPGRQGAALVARNSAGSGWVARCRAMPLENEDGIVCRRFRCLHLGVLALERTPAGLGGWGQAWWWGLSSAGRAEALEGRETPAMVEW